MGSQDDCAAPRVALADDHAEVLEEIRMLLEPEFRVVCSANEGAALLRAMDESKSDGVVADVQMPGAQRDRGRRADHSPGLVPRR